MGIVSHDVRNPLSSIGLGIALLARDNPSERRRHSARQDQRSTDRANGLVADLLDFTQARLGRGLSASREPIDLHETVAYALEELAVAYPGRTLRHLQTGERECSADANRLVQLVGNLVSNAAAYGQPETAVTVTSSVEATSFSIAVHNTGAPIPLEAQSRLFEPMTRGTHASKSGRSVGLGLFIVREIAESHGGSAHVKSTIEDRHDVYRRVPPRLSAPARESRG